MARVYFPLADPANGPIGAARLFIATDGEAAALPDDAFFVGDVRRAWRSLSDGEAWALLGDKRLCWEPPDHTAELSGPSANLATAIVVYACCHDVALEFDEVWATGRLSAEGKLEGVLGLAHKVELFLAGAPSGARVLFAPLENHDQIEAARKRHAGRFEEVEFLPDGPTLPRPDVPLIVWVARADGPALLRSLCRRRRPRRRLLATLLTVGIVGVGAALSVGALGALRPRASARFQFAVDTADAVQRQVYETVAVQYARSVEAWVQQRFERLSEASAEPALTENQSLQHVFVLERIALSMPEFRGGVYTLDAKGTVLAQSVPAFPEMPDIAGYEAGHRPYFTDCQRLQRPIITDSFTSADRNEEIIVIAVPRYSPEGHFIGILDAVIDISSTPLSPLAAEALAEARVDDGQPLRLYLLDREDVVIGTSHPPSLGRSMGGDPTLLALRSGADEEPPRGTIVRVPNSPYIVLATWERGS